MSCRETFCLIIGLLRYINAYKIDQITHYYFAGAEVDKFKCLVRPSVQNAKRFNWRKSDILLKKLLKWSIIVIIADFD